jgi:hypothetical protein
VTILVLKLLLVPLLIAAVTWAGGALGPRIAGVLTGFPIVAGPVALVVAIEQGNHFAGHAAAATLAAEASLAVFCVIYCWSCARATWWLCLAYGWAGFAACTLVLRRIAPSFALCAAIALLTPSLIGWLTPRPTAPARKRHSSPREIALRMLAGAAMVLTLTSLAAVLGPSLSGLLTIFPIATSILAASAHQSDGPDHAIYLLRGLAAGLYSVTAFFGTLALALERLTLGAAFGVALLAAFVAQLIVLGVLESRRRRAAY